MRLFILLLGALGVGACAASPGPGEEGYLHDVRGHYEGSLVIEGTEHEAEAEFETEPGGTVTGSFRIDGSTPWRGDVAGSLERSGLLVWRSSWVAPATGCGGTIRARGTVTREGDRVEGDLRAAAECIDPTHGSFVLQRTGPDSPPR